MDYQSIKKKVRQQRKIDRQKFVEAKSFVLSTLTEEERFQYLNRGNDLIKIDDPDSLFTALAAQNFNGKKIVPIAESKVIQDWIRQERE